MWVLYPQIQPTMDWKYLGKKIPESPKMQNLHLLRAGNYLRSIYTVFTTIYIYSTYVVLLIISNLEVI